ncbi:Ig-like domain-containing protein [Escherichia coli]|uniref:Ig-like domain-containing protein n=1 Tax=Escherichia coli TaxID=562 RepID=UPI0010D5C867|nr:Ig-like domain-containing protein [Escherichia coli]GCR58445.1 adhesin [Escherichia coli]
MTLDAQVKSKYGVQNIKWSAPEFIANGGTIERKNQHGVYLHLPAYNAGKKSEYTLTALATDVRGNTNQASTLIRVEKPSLEFAAMDVVKDFAVAGQGKNEVRIRLSDKARNNIADRKVMFSSVQGVIIEPESIQTDFNGTAVVQVSSKTAGPVPVRAALENGNTVQRSVTFMADSKQLHLTLTAKQKHGIVANGVEEHSVNVVAQDMNGNAVQNVPLELNADNGAVLKKDKIITDNKGMAEFRVTNTHAGRTTVKVRSENTENQIELLFSGDPATAVIKNFYADPQYDGGAADGKSENRMVAEVTDANNNPVSEIAVNFFTAESLIAESYNVFTNAEGKSILKIRSRQGGTHSVRACLKSACKESKTRFSSLSPQINKVFVTNEAMADGISKNSIKILVSDPDGHPLEGVHVYLASTEETIKLESNIERTNENGEIQTWVTSSAALFGYIKIGLVKDIYSMQHEIRFQPNTDQSMIEKVWVNKGKVIADGKDEGIIGVMITDNNHNPIKDAIVSAEVTNDAKLDNAKKSTNSAGIAEFRVSNTKVGSISFSACINDQEKKRLDNIITFNGDESSSHLEFKNPEREVKANGIDKYKVDVLVKDSNGIPIFGENILIKSTALQQDYDVITDKDGYASASFQSVRSGTFDVTASLKEKTISTKIRFVDDPSTYHLAQYKTSGPSVANGLQQNQVSVTVLDLLNAPVSQYPVKFSILTEGGHIDNDERVLTNDKGIATVNVTSTTAGTNYIRIESPDGAFLLEKTSFIADKTTKHFSYVVETTTAVANGKDEHIVTLKSQDKNNNIISGDELSFEKIDGLSINPLKGKTDDNGEFKVRVTSIKSGLHYIKTNGLAIPLTFSADRSDYFIRDVKIIKNKDIRADAVDAGAIEFVVTDKNGNPIPEYRLEGKLSGSPEAFLVDPVVYSNSSGVACFTVKSTKIGTANLDWGKSNKASFEFIANKETAYIADIKIIKNGSAYDDSSGNSISVHVVDAFNNPVSNIDIEYRVSSKNDRVSIINATKTNDNGVSTANIIVSNRKYFTSGADITAKVNNSTKSVVVNFTSSFYFDYTATDNRTKKTLQINGGFYDKKTGKLIAPPEMDYFKFFVSESTGQNITYRTSVPTSSFKAGERTTVDLPQLYKTYIEYKTKHPEIKLMMVVQGWIGDELAVGLYEPIKVINN